jgi:hypothetical protein
MNKKYWLVTDAGPAEVEAATGLRGVPSPMGTLVEAPPDPYIEALRMNGLMSRLEKALNPKPPRVCYCAVVHMPPCPLAYAVT